jgi:hypothetical protein
MPTPLDAREIMRLLSLSPLPAEGGYFRETFRSAQSTAIHYLLTPDTFSALHRLRGDEVFHFYLGDPVEMLQLLPDGTSRTIRLGPDLAAGMSLQLVVPGGVWQGCRLVAGGRFALMGTTMAPPFDPRDFDLGDRAALSARYPDRAETIAALTRAR